MFEVAYQETLFFFFICKRHKLTLVKREHYKRIRKSCYQINLFWPYKLINYPL